MTKVNGVSTLTCTRGEVWPQGVAGGTGTGEGALSVPAAVGAVGRARLTLVNVCTRESDGCFWRSCQDNSYVKYVKQYSGSDSDHL